MAVFLPAILKSWARAPSFTTTKVTVPRGTVFGVSTNANSDGLPASTRTIVGFTDAGLASAERGHVRIEAVKRPRVATRSFVTGERAPSTWFETGTMAP